jgi:hypothetical protein
MAVNIVELVFMVAVLIYMLETNQPARVSPLVVILPPPAAIADAFYTPKIIQPLAFQSL